VRACFYFLPQQIQTRKRIADGLSFFGCPSVVELQFMESGIDCGLCCSNAWLHLVMIGFEDGSLVRFLPSIFGFHWSFLPLASRNRSTLPNGQMRFKGEKHLRCRIKPDRGLGEQPFRLPARLCVSFRKKPSP